MLEKKILPKQKFPIRFQAKHFWKKLFYEILENCERTFFFLTPKIGRKF